MDSQFDSLQFQSSTWPFSKSSSCCKYFIKWNKYGDQNDYVKFLDTNILNSGLMMYTFVTMVGGNPRGDVYGFRYWKNPVGDPVLSSKTLHYLLN